MTLRLFAPLALFVLAAPAIAQDAADKPVKEKKICRRSAATGSILGGKPVCHTKSEWTQIDKQNAANTENALDKGLNTLPPNGSPLR